MFEGNNMYIPTCKIIQNIALPSDQGRKYITHWVLKYYNDEVRASTCVHRLPFIIYEVQHADAVFSGAEVEPLPESGLLILMVGACVNYRNKGPAKL